MSYTAAKHRPSFTYDVNLKMKDAGLIAADAAAQVAAADKILDMGDGLFEGELVIDITAVEIASNDERYDICWQVSDSATFASGVHNAAVLPTGALETLIGGDTDTAVGRYVLGVRNELNGTYYRYARVYTNVTGAIATGINYSAFVAKRT